MCTSIQLFSAPLPFVGSTVLQLPPVPPLRSGESAPFLFLFIYFYFTVTYNTYITYTTNTSYNTNIAYNTYITYNTNITYATTAITYNTTVTSYTMITNTNTTNTLYSAYTTDNTNLSLHCTLLAQLLRALPSYLCGPGLIPLPRMIRDESNSSLLLFLFLAQKVLLQVLKFQIQFDLEAVDKEPPL